MMNEYTQNIVQMIKPVLDDMDLELVDFELRGNNRKRVVNVYVYQEGGVTLEACENASRRIADVLEQNDPISGQYVLQVSSPGLDRPLKTQRDFERNIGEKVKIVLSPDHTEKIGIIQSIDEQVVCLTEGDETWQFNLVDLESAKIIIEF